MGFIEIVAFLKPVEYNLNGRRMHLCNVHAAGKCLKCQTMMTILRNRTDVDRPGENDRHNQERVTTQSMRG
jgi:hypothetical protein